MVTFNLPGYDVRYMELYYDACPVQRIVSDLAMYDDGREIQLDLLDLYQLQLELAYRKLFIWI